MVGILTAVYDLRHNPSLIGISPGRLFKFAANEMKTLLAYIVTTYEIKLGELKDNEFRESIASPESVFLRLGM